MQLEAPSLSVRAMFKQVAELSARGQAAAALQVLREALHRSRLDPEGIQRAGNLIRKLTAGAAAPQIRVFGQCTTTWLCTALTAIAYGHGLALNVGHGEFDNVLQDLTALKDSARQVAAVVLVPWNRRLLSSTSDLSPEQLIEEELQFWKTAWAQASDRGARIIQVGYDWAGPGPLGHHLGGRGDGDVARVRRLNTLLRESLPKSGYFIDLDQVSGSMGRERFYDPRRQFWTKQPFSEAGVCLLAEHLFAAVRATTSGPRKVLVLDLDNTLWGGVVGETGPHGVALGEGADGEAYRAFQTYLKQLSKRGILLAVCSKNNKDDALAVFERNDQMVLTVDDCAHMEIGWEPKATGLRRIAQSLRLGLDSFVFFDDNPVEREEIRQLLPEVEVVDVPPDPAEYVRALEGGLWFESVGLSTEDALRSAQYRQEHEREALQKQSASMDEYLRSLDMRARVGSIDDSNIERVVQLLAKTNQFNLTTRRHTLQDVKRLMALPGAVGLTLTISDRFGDYGLVAVIIAIPADAQVPRNLQIDTWLMSCRVIGRTAEHFTFNALMEHARMHGYARLAGEYIPTGKNAPVAKLYDSLGFHSCSVGTGESRRYEIGLDDLLPCLTFVRSAESPGAAPT